MTLRLIDESLFKKENNMEENSQKKMNNPNKKSQQNEKKSKYILKRLAKNKNNHNDFNTNFLS